MIFLPNFFDRYTASLRNTVQISAIKNGKNQKHYNNMKKILTAEATYGYNETVPIDLGEYVSRLFTSLYILRAESEEYFEFRVNIRDKYMVDVKKMTVFLLTACKKCKKAEFFDYRGKPALKIEGFNPEKSKKLINKLSGVSFFEVKKQNFCVYFKFVSTDKKPTETFLEYLDLNNPFSAINIFWNANF
ncbi:MAG: hypothetical protein IJN63_01490 [Clostridia bacterium]|nr:hypothetical protein [Clostridia bacterium]